MRLSDDLYGYLWDGRGNNCHSYLFRNALPGARPHVLVDPGYVVNEINERCLDDLIALAAGDGLRLEDVGLIINTHSHVDHCGASESIARAGTDTEGGVRALISLSRIEDEYRRGTGQELHRMMGLRLEDFEPDFYLQEGVLRLDNGERRLSLELIHTPGHCPGSISIYDPRSRALITGDAVFNRSVGRTDFPGGDGGLLKESIKKLAGYEAEYLLPGHNTEYGNIIEGREKVKQNFEFLHRYFSPLL